VARFPFAELRSTGGAQRHRSAVVHTSRGVHHAAELCVPSGPRVVRASPRRLTGAPFPTRGCASGRPSSAPFEAGSFSRAFRPLRSLFACLPGHFFRSDTVLPGVSSLFAALSGGVHLRGSSQSPATFRPQVFSTSRRFAPPPASRACFIPQPRPGFSVQGLLPLRSATDSSPATASMPFAVRALTGYPAAMRVRRDFEAFLHGVMRSIGLGV